MDKKQNMNETLKGVRLKRITHIKDIPCLVIIHGNDVGRCYPLREGVNNVGRLTEDVSVDDPSMSRNHFQVVLAGYKFELRDLGSTNGTFVDGQQVRNSIEIGTFSKIQAGVTVMKVAYKSSAELNFENRLIQEARNDSLTGLLNKNYFSDAAEFVIQRAFETNSNVAVIMMDLDHFKRVNDDYGHLAGDPVLQEFAGYVNVLTRQDDLLARFGGEEFIALLEGSKLTLDAAVTFAERIRQGIEETTFSYEGHEIRLTVSLGVCFREGLMQPSLGEMIEQADVALYRAKNSGRNQVKRA